MKITDPQIQRLHTLLKTHLQTTPDIHLQALLKTLQTLEQKRADLAAHNAHILQHRLHKPTNPTPETNTQAPETQAKPRKASTKPPAVRDSEPVSVRARASAHPLLGDDAV